jgi:tetratricopeptide (TPR) repeat protein
MEPGGSADDEPDMTKFTSRVGHFTGLALLLAALIPATRAAAQAVEISPDTVRRAEPVIQIPSTDSLNPAEFPPGSIEWVGRAGIRQELLEADRLSSQGRYQDVIDFLLPIWRKELSTRPDEAIAQALKRAYRSLKDYRGMRAIIRQQIEVNPQDPIAQADLAEAFFADNLNDSGRAVIERMLAADPQDRERHHLAAQTYMRASRTNEGLEVYRRARQVLNDSTVFAEDMARIFEARREYAGAVEEYFRWLNARPESQRSVQKYITNLIKVPEASSQITEALQRIVKSYPRHEYAHRLYGDLLLESGRIDSAFAEYRRADALSEQPGQHRLFGIERAIETRKYPIARTEALAFIKDYPAHSDLFRVHLALARAELALGNADVAVDMLKKLAAQFPVMQERLRIYYEIAEVYRRYTPDKDSAAAYFNAIISHPERSLERTLAWLRLGELAIYHGDLARAESAFVQAGNSPAPALREEIAFRQAELLFLRGDYDACATKMKEFMKQFPRGLFVNDAIKYTTLITDGRDEMNWSLNRFAAGLLFLRREMRDSALAAFGQLAADSANRLADVAQYSTGEVYESAAIFERAIDSYRALIARFPGSFMVPRAWARIGEVYADSLGNATEARAAYQVILSDFKSSPVVEEARRRLQNLPVP